MSHKLLMTSGEGRATIVNQTKSLLVVESIYVHWLGTTDALVSVQEAPGKELALIPVYPKSSRPPGRPAALWGSTTLLVPYVLGPDQALVARASVHESLDFGIWVRTMLIWEYRFVGQYWEPPTDRMWMEILDHEVFMELVKRSRLKGWNDKYRHSDLNTRLVKVQVI